MTLYTDIGVGTDADRATIARAHRDAVKRHHPDAGGDRDKFERVQRAWLVLRDPAKRAHYDETGRVDDEPENDLSQLTGILISAFDKAMSQAGPMIQHVDIIASAVRILGEEAAAARGKISEARSLLRRVKAARKRLRFTGDGPDLIGRVLDDRIRDVEAQIDKMDAAALGMDRAAEHLKLYGWEFDRPGAADWEEVSSSYFAAIEVR